MIITGMQVKPRSYARAVAAEVDGTTDEKLSDSVEQQVASFFRSKGIGTGNYSSSAHDRTAPTVTVNYDKIELKTFNYTEYKCQDMESDFDPGNNFYSCVIDNCCYQWRLQDFFS